MMKVVPVQLLEARKYPEELTVPETEPPLAKENV
jgi:hypothetical protein